MNQPIIILIKIVVLRVILNIIDSVSPVQIINPEIILEEI